MTSSAPRGYRQWTIHPAAGTSTVPAPSSCPRQVFTLRHSSYQIASRMRAEGSAWRLFNILRLAVHLQMVNLAVGVGGGGRHDTSWVHIQKGESHGAPLSVTSVPRFDPVDGNNLPGLCGCYFDQILVILGEILHGFEQRQFSLWKFNVFFFLFSIHEHSNEPRCCGAPKCDANRIGDTSNPFLPFLFQMNGEKNWLHHTSVFFPSLQRVDSLHGTHGESFSNQLLKIHRGVVL